MYSNIANDLKASSEKVAHRDDNFIVITIIINIVTITINGTLIRGGWGCQGFPGGSQGLNLQLKTYRIGLDCCHTQRVFSKHITLDW